MQQVVKDIKAGSFGNDFKGTSLEFVLSVVLYFLHPTLMPPCNTAIVNGFIAWFGDKIKLGSWSGCLVPAEMASTIRRSDIVWFAPNTSRVVAAFAVE